MQKSTSQNSSADVVDEVDRARAREYALLATLLSRSPDARLLSGLAVLRGDASLLGVAHAELGEAARRLNEDSVRQEYSDLFGGLGDSSLLPYASHYLTGTLYGRPLTRLRETLRGLGIENAAEHSEPEDHVAIVCEIAVEAGADREFFGMHLAPWARRFFVDLERAKSADFYARVGALGRTLMDVETEAFAF
jgi:TorA maturation chaperone TorD